MKKLILVAGMLCLAQTAYAAKTKGGYVACISESLYDEAMQAVARGDENQWRYVLSNGCVVTKAGMDLSVIDAGFATSKVRIYAPSGTSMIMWTPSENIER